MDGVFVTGTDTSVGKTIVAGGILKLLQGTREAKYWKPVQTGTIVGDDTKDLITVTGLDASCFEKPFYSFPDPLSPHLAASKWGKTIEVDKIVEQFNGFKAKNRFHVVEGAGGLLVPLNNKDLQISLIEKLNLPAIVVVEDRLGAINHTLLTLQACRELDIPVLGVVMTKSRGEFGNAPTIAQFGKVEILAELEPSQDSSQLISNVVCNPGLRKLFKVPELPL